MMNYDLFAFLSDKHLADALPSTHDGDVVAQAVQLYSRPVVIRSGREGHEAIASSEVEGARAVLRPRDGCDGHA